MLDQLTRLWKELGMNQRVSLVLAFLGIIAITGGLLIWASRPRMQLLYGGLDAKDMGEVSKSVEALGIEYEVRNGGSAIYVEAAEVHSARMKLAAEGIPAGGGVGYEIFDTGSFGISSFVQHTNFVRAIQGELSRTINQLNGVNSSRVMIVIPENELVLTGAEKKPTASVFVDTGGRSLGIEAVDSIRALVSSAVEGMNSNDVAVIDNRGNVLSASLKDDGAFGATSSQVKFRKSIEDYYTGKVETMLGRVVGSDNVVVRVSVGLDMDMQTLVEEQYDPDVQVVRSENTLDTEVTNTETKKAGVAGEEANVLGGTTSVGTDGITNQSSEVKKEKETSYEIAKTTIETVKNPGGIRQLNAAVFLALDFLENAQGVQEPQPRTQEQLDRIRLMVVNALGIEYDTEDELERRVTIEEIEFKTTSLSTGVGGVASTFTNIPMMIDMGKSVLAIGISVFMLMFFFRMIKNASDSGSRSGLEVLDPEEENGAHAKDVTPAISPELLNELIKQNPDKVSSALKNWAFPDQ